MNVKQIAINFDKRIEIFLVDCNQTIKHLLFHCIAHTIGLAIVLPLLFLIFQIWTFIVDGYWKSTTLFQIGFVAETNLKGLDFIANYIFDLPLFFSILFTGIISAIALYVVAKAIHLIIVLTYAIMKALIASFNKESSV